VFQLLQQHDWKIKLTKCAFAQQSISYLGHVISSSGVATDPSKVTAVTIWPTPSSVKELRGFLGLAGYYRKFVKNFGILAKPLNELLKKNSIFRWLPHHEQSFRALKSALSSAPVLSLPNFSKTFSIETDACATGIGAVLMLEGHPLAFLSKALGSNTRGLSTYEKEYLAVIMAVQQWRPYLQLVEFIIYTDQQSLVQLTDQRLHTLWQQKLYSKLARLQFKIIYKPGLSNRAADALSHKTSHDSSCAAMSVVVPKWIVAVTDGYTKDPETMEMLSKLTIDPQAVPGFTLRDGIICYGSSIWIGNNPEFQRQLLQAVHSSALGGHSGFPATCTRLKQLFYWRGMKAAVRSFVSSCITCQQAKPDRTRLPGLLQPLPVPETAWQIISLDFIEGLPRSNSVNCILVVVDSFTKYGHFIPLRHPFTAAGVAKAFMFHVYRLHGLPSVIISDRDRIFTSQLWQELFHLADVSLHMSSSYHPQSDGQTECLNQTLETFLRYFVNACPAKWSSWLDLAEFWYNTKTHSATGFSSFEALYGHSPRHFGISVLTDVAVPELSTWLSDRKVITELIQQHLARAKDRMKRQADKKRSERQFQVGDMVFVKIQPYIQSTLAPRSNQKLSYKYYGPFEIISKIGTVAYKLLLPPTTTVHPVFHVSQLKAAVLPGTIVIPSLPSATDISRVPEEILQTRTVPSPSGSTEQVLIRWSGWDEAMATWGSCLGSSRFSWTGECYTRSDVGPSR